MDYNNQCPLSWGKKKQSAHNKFKDENGNLFFNPEDISNQFNDFFS